MIIITIETMIPIALAVKLLRVIASIFVRKITIQMMMALRMGAVFQMSADKLRHTMAAATSAAVIIAVRRLTLTRIGIARIIHNSLIMMLHLSCLDCAMALARRRCTFYWM